MRSDVNDGILFYTPFTHEKNACISTSGSMIYHLFICCTVSEQNPHVITAGIENTVNINFASVSTVEANVIVTYNKTIITLLYSQSKIAELRSVHSFVKCGGSL